MQLSQDLLLYIGQNYLKDTLCIKKLFYHNKDDKLQLILFGEVLYYYKLFSKTTVPLHFLTKFSHRWFTNNLSQKVPRSIKGFEGYLYRLHIDKMFDDFSKLKWECDVLITFESTWDDTRCAAVTTSRESLNISIEYINDNNNEVVDTIDDEELEYFQPNIYKKLKQFILRRIIN